MATTPWPPGRCSSSETTALPKWPLAPLTPILMSTSNTQKCVPILRLRPRLEVVEGDVGKLTLERGAIHRIADAIEPFVHRGVFLAHVLADDIERDLVIVEGAAGDA